MIAKLRYISVVCVVFVESWAIQWKWIIDTKQENERNILDYQRLKIREEKSGKLSA